MQVKCEDCGELFASKATYGLHRDDKGEAVGRPCLDPERANLVPYCGKNETYWANPYSNQDWIK